MIQNISHTHNRIGFNGWFDKKPPVPEKKMEDYQAYKNFKPDKLKEFKKLHPLVQKLVIFENTLNFDKSLDNASRAGITTKIDSVIMHINAAKRKGEIPREDFLKAKNFLKQNQ